MSNEVWEASMRFGPDRSRDDYLADLRAEAERTWGADRAEALSSALETTAVSLWRLAQAELDPLGPEPAFVGPSSGGGAS
jgi:hypothetical protein